MISLDEWITLAKELREDRVSQEEALKQMRERLMTVSTPDLLALLTHWKAEVKRHRRVDDETTRKRRDAEMWVKSIESLLEHPDQSDRIGSNRNEPQAFLVSELPKEGFPDNMTAEEAAKYLRMPVSSLYKGTSRGEIPHRKVGKRLRFTREELDGFLARNKVGSPSDIEKEAEEKLGDMRRKRRER